MTERPRPPYGDSQPGDRLAEIKAELSKEGFIDPTDQEWLVAEVERLRDEVNEISIELSTHKHGPIDAPLP